MSSQHTDDDRAARALDAMPLTIKDGPSVRLMYGAYSYTHAARLNVGYGVVLARTRSEARAQVTMLGYAPGTILPLHRGLLYPRERRALDYLNGRHA